MMTAPLPLRLLLASSLCLVLLAPAAHAKEAHGKAAGKAGGKAARAEAGPGTWYAQRITRGDQGVLVTDLWSKGRRLRSETVFSGIPILTIVSGDWYYVIDVAQQRGVAIRRSQAALLKDRTEASQRPFGNAGAELRAAGAEVIRQTTVAGRSCKVWQLSNDSGRRQVWITDDDASLPLREDTLDRSGAHAVTDYVDWLRDLPLPDSFFEPEPNVQLERIEYDEYLKRAEKGPVGPAPVLFGDLLHGR
jgi:hypothetical protein